MAQLRVAHTAELSDRELREVRALMDAAFESAMDDDDWDHTIGGAHVLARDQDALVGHVSVVQRRLLCQDRALRTGYVEGLAVRADRRRAGLASALMGEAERVIDRAYELGALSDGTGVDGFYPRRGWLTWSGPTFVLAPDGPRWTPDEDGGVLVRRTPACPELDLSSPLGCDWRPGDVW